MEILSNISYEELVNTELIIMSVFGLLAFFASLQERRRYIVGIYLVLAIMMTVLNVVRIFKEGFANDPAVVRSVIKAIFGLTGTTAWAILFGRRSKEKEIYEANHQEEEEDEEG